MREVKTKIRNLGLWKAPIFECDLSQSGSWCDVDEEVAVIIVRVEVEEEDEVVGCHLKFKRAKNQDQINIQFFSKSMSQLTFG